MSVEYRVPELGEGVYEAELVEWKVRPGEMVRHGQILAEVMTDKATMDLPSAFSGTIDRLSAEPGDTIQVGETLLEYTPAEGAPAEPAETQAQSRAPRLVIQSARLIE